jgi:hypothetical protein
MSESTFRLEGLDEVTHAPVRIELRLVTETRDSSVGTPVPFAAPRGFLPDARLLSQPDAAPCHTSCQRQAGLRPDLASDMAPRGFATAM